jgi:hypothetical protein
MLMFSWDRQFSSWDAADLLLFIHFLQWSECNGCGVFSVVQVDLCCDKTSCYPDSGETGLSNHTILPLCGIVVR